MNSFDIKVNRPIQTVQTDGCQINPEVQATNVLLLRQSWSPNEFVKIVIPSNTSDNPR